MTTKTTDTLTNRAEIAATEAARLARELHERREAGQAARDAARLAAALAFQAEELPQLSAVLDAAEAKFHALAMLPATSVDVLWSGYMHLRSLSQVRHDRHNAAVGVMSQLDPLEPNRIGAPRSRPVVADSWTETPWSVLLDRITDRRLTALSAKTYSEELAALDAAGETAAARFED